jgi:hypothetical protein
MASALELDIKTKYKKLILSLLKKETPMTMFDYETMKIHLVDIIFILS